MLTKPLRLRNDFEDFFDTERSQLIRNAEITLPFLASFGHDDPIEERCAPWIGQQDRPFTSHEGLEDWSRARCDEFLSICRRRAYLSQSHVRAKIELCVRGCSGEQRPVLVASQGNIAFEQRHRALRQTVFEGSEGHRAHIAGEVQEDIPAYVEASIAEGRDLFEMQFGKGDIRVEQHAREQCEMFAAALVEQAYRQLFSVEDTIVWLDAVQISSSDNEVIFEAVANNVAGNC